VKLVQHRIIGILKNWYGSKRNILFCPLLKMAIKSYSLCLEYGRTARSVEELC
jgi:hypothetical protein